MGLVTRPVLRITHESLIEQGRTYQEFAATATEPVIITSSLACQWIAASRWTPNYLSAALPRSVQVYHRRNYPVFIPYHDDKPLEEFVDHLYSWEHHNAPVEVTTQRVLGLQSDPRVSDSDFLYFIRNVQYLPPQLWKDIQPLNNFTVNQADIQANLWMGAANITTATHYDGTYNFFFQVQGTKRWTLFPPSTSMYVFPCLHPFYANSQVDIHQTPSQPEPRFAASPYGSPSFFPKFWNAATDVVALEANLSRGELLLVPPYWFHHVQTVTTSVSLNIISDSTQYLLMQKIYEHPLPFELTWDVPKRMRAIHYFSSRLYAAVFKVPDPTGFNNMDNDIETWRELHAFVRDVLVEQRYNVLHARGHMREHAESQRSLQRLCSSSNTRRSSQSAEQRDACGPATAWFTDAPREFSSEFDFSLRKIAPLFLAMNPRNNPTSSNVDQANRIAIQRTLMGNFIEWYYKKHSSTHRKS